MRGKLKFGSPTVTAALFALAGVLLAGGSVGGASAALTYFSETYKSQVEMYDIGVTLNENGKGVSGRNYQANSNGQWSENTGVLLKDRWSPANPMEIGKAYDEKISVTNSGSIDQYVRVSLYKYWEKDGKKQQSMDPDLIELHLTPGDGWQIDESASTKERTVLYYKKILKTGETSAPLTDTLKIDAKVKENKTLYQGAKFMIKAEVDAVQTHNAEDAIWSAWGRKVSADGATLRLQ